MASPISLGLAFSFFPHIWLIHITFILSR
ncbi:hypothetical protein YPPY14_3237, partial [Yersinia pestis PY-14]